MFRHGEVDLSRVSYESLIGRSSRENFEESSLACKLQHKEPIVQISPPAVTRQGQDQLLPVSSDLVPTSPRIKVWIPHLGFAAWVDQAAASGDRLIKWGVGGDPKCGLVDLADASGSTSLVGRFREDERWVACRLSSGHFVHAEVPTEGDRRVRVWVPRLEVACWVWQAGTDGTPLVKWFEDASERSTAPVAVVQVTADVAPKEGFVAQLRNRVTGNQPGPSLSQGDIVLRCSLPRLGSTDHFVRLPGSDAMVEVKASSLVDCFPPLRLLIMHRQDFLPGPLLHRVDAALSAYVMQADSAAAGSEAEALLGRAAQQRDDVWRDVLDPDLCLADPTGTGADMEWQTAEVDVDGAGVVRWASWLNHVDEHRHRALLDALAELLGAVLPSLEKICSRSLRSMRLQVVCRATDHVMTGESHGYYHISEWHMDGTPKECILATAVSYIEVEDGLSGGAVEFAGKGEVWLDDPAATEIVLPRKGSLIVFDNFALRHRVKMLSGRGRRRLVAFHLVDPDNRQQPSAAELPRQWRQHQIWALQALLAPIKPRLGPHIIRRVAELAAEGCAAPELVERRGLERLKRLRRNSFGFSTGTGTWEVDS